MKIGELHQHCGDCNLIEFCGDPYGYCLCHDERFEDMASDDYEILAEKVDWSGFTQHPPCRNCQRDCDECEEQSEERDISVRYIADKVAELLTA
jgi:hypothetical protein